MLLAATHCVWVLSLSKGKPLQLLRSMVVWLYPYLECIYLVDLYTITVFMQEVIVVLWAEEEVMAYIKVWKNTVTENNNDLHKDC